jgi:ubiquitin-conjugating enzyme E2 J1
MSTYGQFSTKNPTIKRIHREARELSLNPSPDLHASPLESDLFEWHFTLRGPPQPSPYAGGIYHGRIVLPPTYPLRPPSFRFLTPSGRFEVNREICLSISGYHEESWQPAWGIRTALTAIRSFMDTDVKGQVGGLQCDEAGRRQFAVQSREWVCPVCRKSNKAIMEEREEECRRAVAEGKEKKEDVVPEELRLAYREDLAAGGGENKNNRDNAHRPAARERSSQPTNSPTVMTGLATTQAPRRPPAHTSSDDAWIDKAIYAVAALLAILVARKLLLFL